MATSIPPKLARQDAGRPVDSVYQRLCACSWIDAGFRVVSINDRDEIAALAPLYRDIEFVPTDRNASAWTGRKNPYIADLLGVLVDASEPVVGIINSDLLFESSPAWAERLPSLVGNAVIAGQRCDVTALQNGMFRKFWQGFDFFFFDSSLAKTLLKTAMPFAMGLPFWDYWLPAAAAAQRDVLVATRPAALHLMHEHAYPEAALCDFTRIFATFVTQAIERMPGPLPACLAAVAPVCRRIVSAGEGASNTDMLNRVSDIIGTFLPPIRAHTIDLTSQSAPGQPTQDVFCRFEQRVAAGEAFERADAFQAQGQSAEAERAFQIAFDNTPEDFDVLMGFGEFLTAHGDKARAFDLLNRALALRPNSPRPHNSFGVAFHAMGRADEAIRCFQNALRVDPKFKFAYLSLAVALFQTNRRREALACVEGALAQWPDFPEAKEMHANIASVLQPSAQPM